MPFFARHERIFDFNANWYILLIAFLSAWSVLTDCATKMECNTRSKRTSFSCFRRNDLLGHDGVLCCLNRLMVLHARQLANNPLAYLLCSNTLRLSIAKISRRLTFTQIFNVSFFIAKSCHQISEEEFFTSFT